MTNTFVLIGSADTVDDSWDRDKAEQEWIAQSRNRYGRDDAQ